MSEQSDEVEAKTGQHETELRELRGIVYRLAHGKCACGVHVVNGERWPIAGGGTHGPGSCTDVNGAVLAEVKRPKE